jgi:hypothetical protein
MFDQSLHNKYKTTLAHAVRNASANGTGVDLFGHNSATAVIQVGTWTDGTHTFTLEESDDNSTYSTVSADQCKIIGATGTVADRGGANSIVVDAANEDDAIYGIAYLGYKHYARVRHAVAGATTGCGAAATIHLGRPMHAAGQPV